MSNRTDFDCLSRELAEMYGLSEEARERIETEFHNAHVAALEGTPCECSWCVRERAAVNARIDKGVAEVMARRDGGAR